MRTTVRGLAVVLAGVGACLAWWPGPAGAQEAEGESSPVAADEAVGDQRVVVADGHVDIGPRFLDGAWTLLVRDDTVEPSRWRRLSDVVLQATDAATVEVPGDPDFAFLGAPGAQVWLLPQVQQPGILWPGWNTQDPDVATTVREVAWSLTGVEGPGAFVLFVNGEFGRPTTIFDSRQPYPQATGIDANTHAHGNWTFTAPGVYLLHVEMTATGPDGADHRATDTLRIAVGDATDPQSGFAAAGTAPAATDGPAAAPRDNGPAADVVPPERAAPSPSDGDLSESSAWLAVVAGAVVLLALGGVIVARRRSTRPQASESDGAAP